MTFGYGRSRKAGSVGAGAGLDPSDYRWRLLPETQTAVRLGFGRFAHFKRALREGRIPQPDVVLPDGPRWSEASLERWITGAIDHKSIEAESQALIEALRSREPRRRTPPAQGTGKSRQDVNPMMEKFAPGGIWSADDSS